PAAPSSAPECSILSALTCPPPSRVTAPVLVPAALPVLYPHNLFPGTANSHEEHRKTGDPPAGNPRGARPLQDLYLDRRPFLPSSLALGIPRHCEHSKQPSYRSPQLAHRGLNL